MKVLEKKEHIKSTKPFINFSRKYLGIPYGLFLVLFVVLPLLLIVYYAFTIDGSVSFDNVGKFFADGTLISTVLITIFISLVTTVLCLLIGYPVALFLSKMSEKRGYMILLLFIMPMWINFTLRALGMKEILSMIGVLGKSQGWNYVNTIIGMVYDFLPFTILPIYSVLIKMDKSLQEAALDLGANKRKVFTKVTLPLSMPGILSAATMVFLPVMSCYVVSDTFSNFQVQIIGKTIEEKFLVGSDWNYGSLLAVVLLVIMFVAMLLTNQFNGEEGRGRRL